MAKEPSRLDKAAAVLDKPWRVIAFVVNGLMRNGEIGSLIREGIKDLQNGFYDFAFGHSDHSREPGTPWTPLFTDIKESRGDFIKMPPLNNALPSPSQIVKDSRDATTAHGPAHDPDKPRTQSPSEIVKESRQQAQEQDHAHEREAHDHER